jgi:hypothetical protein
VSGTSSALVLLERYPGLFLGDEVVKYFRFNATLQLSCAGLYSHEGIAFVAELALFRLVADDRRMDIIEFAIVSVVQRPIRLSSVAMKSFILHPLQLHNALLRRIRSLCFAIVCRILSS